MIILAVSLLIMPLSLLLASRFISLEMEKSNRKNPNFYLVGAIMRQVRGSLWFIFSLSVYLWWVVYVSHDEDLHERFCSGSQAACCDKCVWVFGIIFLLISVGVGGVSRAYQYFTIYMIKSMCHVMDRACHVTGSMCHMMDRVCHVTGSMCHVMDGACHVTIANTSHTRCTVHVWLTVLSSCRVQGNEVSTVLD